MTAIHRSAPMLGITSELQIRTVKVVGTEVLERLVKALFNTAIEVREPNLEKR